jgi:hypothetical protein
MEGWRGYVNEQEDPFKTIGDLRQALKRIRLAKKGKGVANVAKDIAVSALLGVVGAGSVKSLFDLVKPLYTQPDDKKTNTSLDRLNVDDEISAIVDDTIEDNFIKDLSQILAKLPDKAPFSTIDITRELSKYIAGKYSGRTAIKPEEAK